MYDMQYQLQLKVTKARIYEKSISVPLTMPHKIYGLLMAIKWLKGDETTKREKGS
jgi:hypothetical protein